MKLIDFGVAFQREKPLKDFHGTRGERFDISQVTNTTFSKVLPAGSGLSKLCPPSPPVMREDMFKQPLFTQIFFMKSQNVKYNKSFCSC